MRPEAGDKCRFTDKFENKGLKGIVVQDNKDGTYAVEEVGIGLVHYIIPEKDITIISKK